MTVKQEKASAVVSGVEAKHKSKDPRALSSASAAAVVVNLFAALL